MGILGGDGRPLGTVERAELTALLQRPDTTLRCAHGKEIHRCPHCSAAGQQYEMDRELEATSGGQEPEWWWKRADQFAKVAFQNRHRYGAGSPECRQAKQACRECRELARALVKARKTRAPGEGPRQPDPKLHLGATLPGGELVDLDAERP